MVRYTKGGGESCAVAVRIARGTTGKDKILFSGYHGWHDWYQSANYLVDPESGEFPFAGIEPTGVPKALAGTAIPFIYEDIDNLRQLFEENKGEVAAVMMEPMRSERPKEGYLEAVKDLCHANDALLIFDEVSSGWRISLGSAQEWLGITPTCPSSPRPCPTATRWAASSAPARRWSRPTACLSPAPTGATTSASLPL